MIGVGMLATGWAAVVVLVLLHAASLGAVRRRTRFLPANSGARRAVTIQQWPAVRGAVAAVARAIRARRVARSRRHVLEREVATVADLLAVAVGAGMTPYLAVDAVTPGLPSVCAEAFAVVAQRVRAGGRFAEALEVVAAGAPALRPLTDALLASERLGAPVAPALARVAADARAEARRRAEVRARAVPVKLLFPLVFLVLPAFGLLTVVPAIAGGFTR